MPELVYHNGHYHRRPVAVGDRHQPRHDDWSVMKLWDEVLYSIGDFYYKTIVRGQCDAAEYEAERHLPMSTLPHGCPEHRAFSHLGLSDKENKKKKRTSSTIPGQPPGPDTRLPNGPYPSSGACAVAPRKGEALTNRTSERAVDGRRKSPA
ncbi:hypothetical protein V8C35DRAFT_224052 [Trichoderma chlorosporum]